MKRLEQQNYALIAEKLRFQINHSNVLEDLLKEFSKAIEVTNNTSFTLSMMVVNQVLYCSINGIPAAAISDNVQSGIAGLMVQLPGVTQPSSKVEFSDAELDE